MPSSGLSTRLSTTTGMELVASSCLRRERTSQPSISGRRMSSVMASGLSSRAFTSASLPVLATSRCELDGVGDEVQEHLPELARVRDEVTSAGDIQVHGDPLLGCEGFGDRRHLAHRIRHRYAAEPELHLTSLDLR